MSDYQIRNGIVLEEICGRYVLISTEVARGKCDYIRLIDDITAYYWTMMEESFSLDQMVDAAFNRFKNIPRSQLKNDIDELIRMLKDLGYLLKDNE